MHRAKVHLTQLKNMKVSKGAVEIMSIFPSLTAMLDTFLEYNNAIVIKKFELPERPVVNRNK